MYDKQNIVTNLYIILHKNSSNLLLYVTFILQQDSFYQTPDDSYSMATFQHIFHYYKSTIYKPYSHSIVPGGFEVMSYTTRLIPATSLIIRFETLSKNAWGKCEKLAVIPSIASTALTQIVLS